MTAYRVIVQNRALADLHEAYEYATQHAPAAAAQWLDRFQSALASLGHNPQRCSLAHENPRSPRELREFLFGRRPNVFRVVFTVDGDAVRILRIRRSARRFLSRRDIRDALDEAD